MTADVLLHINTVQKIDLNKFEANLWKGKINEEQSKTYFLSINLLLFSGMWDENRLYSWLKYIGSNYGYVQYNEYQRRISEMPFVYTICLKMTW